VEALTRPRNLARLAALVLALFVAYEFWHWVVERVEVPAGQFLVRIHLWGEDLDEDTIIAPDGDHKGVMLAELPEGRHFLNPLAWSYERHNMLEVPVGKCAVLTRRYGARIPPERVARGDFLAGDGERGILRDPLLQGKFRINPHAYKVELFDAVQIRAGEVGVRTLKVGKDPRELLVNDPRRAAGREPSPYVVPDGFRGVQEKELSAGIYYINPYVESIVPVQVRSRRVEFTDIEFPSRDGFTLKPHVLVTYRVVPEKAPELFVMLTHEGRLHQEDATEEQQEQNEILQKVVLPFIRGYVRMEGSNYDARDFISLKGGPQAANAVNPRERLQREMIDKVVPECQKVGLEIESITLATMDAPPELVKQISDRELARVEREKNQDVINQWKSKQTLEARRALIAQQAAKVGAQKDLQVSQTLAHQRREVEESKLKQDLDNAQIRLEAAKSKAKEILANAKAEANVVQLQNEAEVAGLKKAVSGFPSAEYFAQYHVLMKLAPALGEIFASDTSEFAKLFASYMTPPVNKPAPTAAAATARAPAGPPPMGTAR
jgi:regulator of protease activity HflC (stomatin/prohibitin superfamily)